MEGALEMMMLVEGLGGAGIALHSTQWGVDFASITL